MNEGNVFQQLGYMEHIKSEADTLNAIYKIRSIADMEYYKLTTLERIVFAEMADCNPGTTPEMIWLYGTAVEDVSCLAVLPKLKDLNLRKTLVTDVSAFKGRENILGIERKKLGIVKTGKSAAEIKAAIQEIKERLDKLGVTPRPPLEWEDIAAFQNKTGVKLPKEYAEFLLKIGNGFEIRLQSFFYKFPPLAEALYNEQGIKKRFSHREAWRWEDDDSRHWQKNCRSHDKRTARAGGLRVWSVLPPYRMRRRKGRGMGHV